MTADIANGNVTNSKLAAGSVDTLKISTGGVTSEDIGDGEVTSFDIGSDQIIHSHIGGGQIFSTHIVNGAITADDLGPDSIGGSEMQGINALRFAQCSVNPPPIAGEQRKIVTFDCGFTSVFGRVIAFPPRDLENGLVPCGSSPSATVNGWVDVCIANVFDTTNVDGISRIWTVIAFTTGSG